jgi:alpha-tubulin suppressor-like RCC1 family protein
VGTSSNWKTVAAGWSHACAINGSGALSCWGDNSEDELGELGQQAHGVCSFVSPNSATWISVAAGNLFTVGIEADGAVYTWGYNASGQLGTNSTSGHVQTPTQIYASTGSPSTWVAVSAGKQHAMAIGADGSLWSWGDNSSGQLGIGSTGSTYDTPQKVTAPSGHPAQWIAIAAGGYFSLGILADGTLWAWGANGAGQLGQGNTTAKNSPTQIADPSGCGGGSGCLGFQYISAGYDFAFAVTANGNLYSWGDNSCGTGCGQLANPSDSTTSTATRVPDTSSGEPFIAMKPAILAGGSAYYSQSQYEGVNGGYISTSGVLKMWGDNTMSGYSAASDTLGLSSSQQTVDTSAGACSSNGPSGTGTDFTCWSPVPIPSTSPWLQVATGATQTLAIRSDGTLWGWGDNASGEVGNGTKTAVATPTQIGTANNWLKVFANPSLSTSVGIRADGSLWIWGTLPSGIGSGTDTSPTQLCTSGSCSGKYWTQAAAGGNTLFAISTDGQLWGLSCGGDTAYGCVKSNLTPPVQIDSQYSGFSGKTWLDAQASQHDTGAFDSTGAIWYWGYDNYGQAGNGSTMQSLTTPANPTGVSGAISVVECSLSLFALDVQNNLWGWGANDQGELGLSGGSYYTATNVITSSSGLWGLTDPVISMACGNFTSFVEDVNTKVWTVGSGAYGELGAGSSSKSQVTTPIVQPFYLGPYNQLYPAKSGGTYEEYGSPTTGESNVNNSGYWTTSSNQGTSNSFYINFGASQYIWGVEVDSNNATDILGGYTVSVTNTSGCGSGWTTVASGTNVTGGQYLSVTFPVQAALCVKIAPSSPVASVPWNIQTFYAYQ